jgi:hypothetical protein
MVSPAARRRILLGDWNRFVRDPLDLARIGFVVLLVVFAVQGDVKGTFNMVVGTVMVLTARAINLPRLYDLALILAMVFTMVGEAFGLYDAIAWYDRLVHFVVPLFACQVMYIALARIEVLPDLKDETALRHGWGIFVVTAALGIAVGGVWEVFEFTSDGAFGSNLSEGNSDTVGDLIADSAGSFAGAGLLVLYAKRGWGSVKRIPGENRFEEVSA